VDVRGAFLELVVGRASPRLRSRLEWSLARRSGDQAVRVAEHLAEPGRVALDVGASWGLFTGGLSRLVGPAGRVHAFEPGPHNLPSLRRVAAANAVVHEVGLSDTEGEAVLHVPLVRGRPTHALASFDTPRGRGDADYETVRVPVRRLDDVPELRDADVSFVKCDVEGHERAVLAGADALLGRTMPAILVEIEQRHQDSDIGVTIDGLLARGYDGYVLGAAGLRPVREFDVERDQLAHLDAGGELVPRPAGDYLNDFLFVDPGRDVSALLGSPGGR